jgi:hypothetical protein
MMGDDRACTSHTWRRGQAPGSALADARFYPVNYQFEPLGAKGLDIMNHGKM